MMLLIVALAACSGKKDKSVNELRSEYRAQLEPKMAKMIAGSKLVTATHAAPPVPIELRGTEAFGDDPGHATNAVIASGADLADEISLEEVHGYSGFQFQSDSDNHVLAARRILSKEPVRYASESLIKEMIAARYLLIVSGSMSDGYVSSGGFAPGSATGTVRLVDLDTGTLLDELSFSAKSSESLYTSKSSTGSSDADEKIKRDLRSNTSKAIRDGIQKRWPGAGVPSSWGY